MDEQSSQINILYDRLNNCDYIDKFSIKRNSSYTVQFQYKEKNDNFDAIIISNIPMFDEFDDNFFSIILMIYSKRLGCFIEGYRNPINGIFGRGWVLNRNSIEEILSILPNI